MYEFRLSWSKANRQTDRQTDGQTETANKNTNPTDRQAGRQTENTKQTLLSEGYASAAGPQDPRMGGNECVCVCVCAPMTVDGKCLQVS